MLRARKRVIEKGVLLLLRRRLFFFFFKRGNIRTVGKATERDGRGRFDWLQKIHKCCHCIALGNFWPVSRCQVEQKTRNFETTNLSRVRRKRKG